MGQVCNSPTTNLNANTKPFYTLTVNNKKVILNYPHYTQNDFQIDRLRYVPRKLEDKFNISNMCSTCVNQVITRNHRAPAPIDDPSPPKTNHSIYTEIEISKEFFAPIIKQSYDTLYEIFETQMSVICQKLFNLKQEDVLPSIKKDFKATIDSLIDVPRCKFHISMSGNINLNKHPNDEPEFVVELKKVFSDQEVFDLTVLKPTITLINTIEGNHFLTSIIFQAEPLLQMRLKIDALLKKYKLGGIGYKGDPADFHISIHKGYGAFFNLLPSIYKKFPDRITIVDNEYTWYQIYSTILLDGKPSNLSNLGPEKLLGVKIEIDGIYEFVPFKQP